MKISKMISWILLIFLFLISCQHESKFLSDCESNKSFYLDTPKGNFYTRINTTAEFLGLKKINISMDTFFLRIWNNNVDSLKIFEFLCYKSSKVYKEYIVPVEKKSGKILFDKITTSLNDYSRKGESLVSKNFYNKLEEIDILNLPDCQTLNDYPLDGESGIFIETSNKCRYKLVWYKSPELNKNNFKEAKRVSELLKDINF